MLVAHWLHTLLPHTLRKEQIFLNFRITGYLAEILIASTPKFPSKCITLTRVLFSCQPVLLRQLQPNCWRDPPRLQQPSDLTIRMMVTSLDHLITDFCHACIFYSIFLSQRTDCERLGAFRINKRLVQIFTAAVYCWGTLVYTLALWNSLCWHIPSTKCWFNNCSFE